MEFVAGLQVVGHGLLGVLLMIEVFHAVAGGCVLAELGFVFGLVEFGFVVEIFFGCVFGRSGGGAGFEDVDGVDVVG